MKRNLTEILNEMYHDKSSALLNLFCASLISADTLIDRESCLKHQAKLSQFERFLEKQEETEKKAYYISFCKNAHEIIKRELKQYSGNQ